jgi:hypothetical protein
MRLIVRLHYSLVLTGIFLLNSMSAKANFESSSIDTMRHETTWFDKNDTIQFFPVCGTDGQTYLNPIEAQFFGVHSWTEGRCNTYKEILSIEPNAFWIQEITLNEVSNTSVSNPVGFSDYTNIVLEVYKNKENILFYKSNAISQKSESELSIWIDLNKNGIFEKSELLGKENILSNEGDISFLIPPSIKPFLMTRMRIVCNTTNANPIRSFIDKGEVEDYTIIVIE